MNTSKCPSCTGEAKLAYRAKDYNRSVSETIFDYFHCRQCGCVFLANIPQNLGQYYQQSYYDIPRSREELDSRARALQSWKIELVKSVVPSGKLLEVGPAYGLFAHLAKLSGYDVTVIEMDKRCSEFLQNTVGVDVVNSENPVKAISNLGKFDIIVLWQVIEHLPDALELLDLIPQHLSPGGVFIFDCPNPQAFQFAVLGRRWTHLDAPRHVILLPATLVKDRLLRHGMRPELLTASDHSARGFNGFGWAFSFKNLVRNDVLGKVLHFMGRVLSKLLIPIERTGFRGSTYTAVFRKEGRS